MEYFQTDDAQIYADIAYRLGRIVEQYECFYLQLAPEERFNSTLYLSILQILLTICEEHLNQLKTNSRHEDFAKSLNDLALTNWGVDEKCWIKNTFKEEKNLENFITRLRNSVSHPTKTSLDSDTPSTGYTAVKDSAGNIKSFCFINSPDVKNNQRKYYKKDSFENLVKYRYSFCQDGIEFKEDSGDKGYLYLNGKPYIRLSIIKLDVHQLKQFVKALANYMAQPIQKNWSGFEIVNLLAK